VRVLSLAAGTVLDAEPVEVVSAAAAAGFDACGLRLDPAHSSRSLVRAVRSRLADVGISLLDLEVIRMRAGRPVAEHRPSLELAAELGADWALTVLHIPDPLEQVDRLGHLDEIAAELGVRLSVEFMAFTALHDFAAATALVEAVPRCRVLVDALHLARTGGSAEQVAPYAGLLSYVQLCDAPLVARAGNSPDALADEARHHRLLPGAGELDLDGLVRVTPGVPRSVEVQSDELTVAMTPAERAVAAYRAGRAVVGPTNLQD
jgi:sugar phosphate isomerase/epimerase